MNIRDAKALQTANSRRCSRWRRRSSETLIFSITAKADKISLRHQRTDAVGFALYEQIGNAIKRRHLASSGVLGRCFELLHGGIKIRYRNLYPLSHGDSFAMRHNRGQSDS